ncbi:MAG TPA: HAMP domain-containing sensor histidine kinase [Gemmatimonadaceae bacterium]|nr:HAMP domain-containing sensor histidine kinase [Gemmatimonadaceae bacterium]
MSFRSKLLVALAVVTLLPLAGFALAIRQRMSAELAAQYRTRVSAMSDELGSELARRDGSIDSRLATLSSALPDDNRLRLALQGVSAERQYLLDWAERAMRLTALSMLQLQDERGRILSSGHFRNEFDRLEPGIPRAVSTAPSGLVLHRTRAPDGPFLALVRADSVMVGDRRFWLVGGERITGADITRLVGDRDLTVSLSTPDTTLSSDTARVSRESGETPSLVRQIDMWYVTPVGADSAALQRARLTVTHRATLLDALRRSVDRWFLAVAAAAAAAALLIALWLGARMSRPIAELADKTAGVDLDRLDVDFRSDRDDEIGDLSRLLGAMTARLRAGTRKLREAERMATLGEVARQVNHDIKNGLIPIRNVVRHLAQVQRETPSQLAEVFGERVGTLESSVQYLETLAQSYARLSPRPDRRACDVGPVVEEIVSHARAGTGADIAARVSPSLPRVVADPVVLRRILENLTGNAIDSLDGRSGRVVVSAERVNGESGHSAVRITVEDTGRGMTEEELSRAFDDFYTTKPHGTGLGLSVVRRLVLDLNGSLRVSTRPGAGSSFVVELPGATT